MRELDIIKHFGVKNQLKKLNEETYELTEAVLGYENGDDTKEHVEEEMADCLILLNQILRYYKLDHDAIKEQIDYKLDRTIERIKTNFYEQR